MAEDRVIAYFLRALFLQIISYIFHTNLILIFESKIPLKGCSNPTPVSLSFRFRFYMTFHIVFRMCCFFCVGGIFVMSLCIFIKA